MITEKIGVRLLFITLCLVLFIEISAGVVRHATSWNAMAILGVARIIEILFLFMVIHRHCNGLAVVGLRRADLWPGIKIGLIWSAGFALTAGLGAATLYAMGINAVALIRTPLPGNLYSLFLFFTLAGFIAPVAEELFFRGIVYGFFKKWGVICAIAVSTLIFVMMHSVNGIPITQAVGGIVFAVAYETSKSLMTPMIIHILGNCAIFTLSLIL